MRVFELIHHSYVIEFDVQVLIHALQCPSNRNIVLQFDRDFVVHWCGSGIKLFVSKTAKQRTESFEEAEEQHDGVRLWLCYRKFRTIARALVLCEREDNPKNFAQVKFVPSNGKSRAA